MSMCSTVSLMQDSIPRYVNNLGKFARRKQRLGQLQKTDGYSQNLVTLVVRQDKGLVCAWEMKRFADVRALLGLGA